MHTRTVNVSEVEVSRATREVSRAAAWREHDARPVCCGKPMEFRLARAHDRLGQTLFVAVRQCPAWGRVNY